MSKSCSNTTLSQVKFDLNRSSTPFDKVKALVIKCHTISLDWLQGLNEFSEANEFQFTHCEFDQRFLPAFTEDRSFRSLILDNCRLTDRDVTVISTNIMKGKGITCLDLSGNPITDEGLSAVSSILDKVKVLAIHSIGSSSVGIKSFTSQLQKKHSLEHLYIDNYTSGDIEEIATAIIKSESLSYVSIKLADSLTTDTLPNIFQSLIKNDISITVKDGCLIFNKSPT